MERKQIKITHENMHQEVICNKIFRLIWTSEQNVEHYNEENSEYNKYAETDLKLNRIIYKHKRYGRILLKSQRK